MAPDPRATREGAVLDEDSVAAFLAERPEFFLRRPDLLRQLVAPAPVASGDGRVVDFQAAMVQRLRRDQELLRGHLEDVLEVARTNLSHQGLIHAAVLALIEAPDLESLVTLITGDLAGMLEVDVVGLAIEAGPGIVPHPHRSGMRVVESGTVGAWLGQDEVLLESGIEGDPVLFGAGAGLVHSHAMVRLDIGPESPPGLLAFGSRAPDTFLPGMGTELMRFLARVTERCLRQRLGL